jgi:uncharacterized protein (TIGR03067 family)
MSRKYTSAALVIVVLAAGLFAAAPPAGNGPGVAELQGAWKLESAKAEAGAVDLPDPRPILSIRGERLLYGEQEIGRIKADPACRLRMIDLRFSAPKTVYEGIYKIEKGTLKLCINGRTDGIKERPLSFAIKGKPAWRLLTFQRAKTGEGGAGNGFVGIALKFDAGRQEVVIENALDGSPASKAGARPGDVLLEVAGEVVSDLPAAVAAVRRAKPGKLLALQVRRGGKAREVRIKVGLLPFDVLTGLR